MIADPWIDRTWRPKRKPRPPKPPRVFKTPLVERQIVRIQTNDRRAELVKLGVCICGPKTGLVGKMGVAHGPVYKNRRCRRCWNIKYGKPADEGIEVAS